MTHYQFWRIQMWAYRYVRWWRDALQATLLIAIFTLVALMSFAHFRLALLAGAICSLFVFMIGRDVVRNRRARDYLQAAILQEFFANMNREVFGDDPRTRFTLFRTSPFNEKHIVPWYRYTKGTTDVIKDALSSKVSYEEGEGFTGDAWLHKGEDLVIASFPDFEGSRKKFDAYYKDTVGLKPETVDSISDVMIDVRTILSYGFVDENRGFLGVISIDLLKPMTVDGVPPVAKIGDEYLYGEFLTYHLRSIGMVLTALSKAEGT